MPSRKKTIPKTASERTCCQQNAGALGAAVADSNRVRRLCGATSRAVARCYQRPGPCIQQLLYTLHVAPHGSVVQGAVAALCTIAGTSAGEG